ncbi:MAG: GNAT family N-acetyltransferase [Bacteroidota bacterium]
MGYLCLNKTSFDRSLYTLSAIRQEDMMSIMHWRNAQMDVLRQKKRLTEQDQMWYFENLVSPLFEQEKPPQILLSLFLDSELIGYGGLVHISWEDLRAEVSFLVSPERASDQDIYSDDFSNYLSILKRIAFSELGLNKIFTETYDIRDHHISILEKAGFLLEGRLKKHNLVNGEWTDSLMHGFLKEQYSNEL